MPTNHPPKPDLSQELNDRRIAEFALEESRLSNVAYRFQLAPRERVWKNWDRTEFEPNRYRVMGLAELCLRREDARNAKSVDSVVHRAHQAVLRRVDLPADTEP